MKPNKNNFCGGNFQDWLEVMLVGRCNGNCRWCVEKDGYRPKKILPWREMANSIVLANKKNVILLGGEPTLYNDLKELIKVLHSHKINTYLTTNGSMLTPGYVKENLAKLKGLNISIHDYVLSKNKEITGVFLSEENLKASVSLLKELGVTVRVNCNLIKNHINCKDAIENFVDFAKNKLGANSVRFAELKNDDDGFVSLYKIYGNKYGINNEPFGFGCNVDAIICGMPVNFRMMCGLQTNKKKRPTKPEQCKKQVLYYDGKIYDGWQVLKKELVVTDKQLIKLLNDVAKKKVDPAVAALKIGKQLGKAKGEKVVVEKEVVSDSGGCCY